MLVDVKIILNQVSPKDIVQHFGSFKLLQNMHQGDIINFVDDHSEYLTVKKDEAGNYVNVEKSAGTEAFYELLEQLINNGKISLELLVGRIAVKKIMNNVKG
jgi:hypothetical protein